MKKFDIFGSQKKEEKKVISSIKKEMQKANDKENYLEEDEKVLIRNFIIKIKKELEILINHI